jgi:hypothetical protein
MVCSSTNQADSSHEAAAGPKFVVFPQENDRFRYEARTES